MTSVIEALKNVEYATNFAFDITSQVIKIAYLVKFPRNRTEIDGQVSKRTHKSSHLIAVQLRVDDFTKALEFIKEKALIFETIQKVPVLANDSTLPLAEMIQKILEVKLIYLESMDARVRGMEFLLKNILDESFQYTENENKPHYLFETIDHSKPYLIVALGTGLQIVRVDPDGRFRRLRGSSIGTSTFLGLASAAFGVTELEDMIGLAEKGDHRRIDTLVSDIYGDRTCHNLQIPSDIVAGSFAKVSNKEYVEQLREEGTLEKDGLRSLLQMLAYNIAQIAVLSAQEPDVEPPARIFFDGALIRNYPIVMKIITMAVTFWSMGRLATHFFRHEGYADVIGTLIHSLKGDTQTEVLNWSWEENVVGSSEFTSFVPKYTAEPVVGRVTSLELICLDSRVERFPYLHPEYSYFPDTLDFQDDNESRQKWIDILSSSIDKVTRRAIESQRSADCSQRRGQLFMEKLENSMKQLAAKPQAYGTCNARDLLDIREQLLREYGFDDVYKTQKHLENESSLKQLTRQFELFDRIEDEDIRLLQAVRGFLAGNVFDWGAKEIVQLLQNEGITFKKALDLLKPRPWLIDHFDIFAQRLKDGEYQSCLIFCDNSGADFVLGVLPFVRELLKRNIMVTLATNQAPALNDIILDEAIQMVKETARIDPLIARKLIDEDLIILHSGHASPCLDLRRVNIELSEACLKRQVDLVIFEGMGRSLHTNLNARLTVDCIKAAVVKTQWLADIVGGTIFDSVFKLEIAGDQ